MASNDGRRNASGGQGQLGGALLRMLLYLAVVLSPLIVVASIRPPSEHGFTYTVGKNLALVGFAVIAMQFVVSARLRWIERPFGLNVLFQFHKTMAIVASLLILSHPVLLAIGGKDWSIVFDPEILWHIWLGRIALLLVLVQVLLGVFRFVIRLNYETWRFVHNVFAAPLAGLAFFHSWKAGGDLALAPMKALWVILFVAAAVAYLWHRVVRTWVLRRHPWQVSAVRREGDDVWTIELTPPPGRARFDYLPGQFHFLTLQRAPHLSVEEHPWTISSSPTAPGVLTSTIKESGDFTASIDKTRVGDTALVDGPFGRFSYVLHPQERDLLFIAGGIGITPLMSMLRHLRDTGAERNVTLLHACTAETDLVFRDELAAMARETAPKLTLVQVLNKPSETWTGERGVLDEEKIKRLAGSEIATRGCYVCAPPTLIHKTIRTLRALGVPAARIHFERFNL